MNLDHFGMDTITLAGPLEAKLRAVREAGFTQIMLNANDIVGHPEGEQAAIKAVKSSGLRVTGFQVLRDFEGLEGHLHEYKVDVAKAMLEMCRALGSRVLLVCSSASPHASDDAERLARDLRKLATLAVPLDIRIAYEALSWGKHVSEYPQAWEIVQRAERHNLGLALDSFHILATGTTLEALEELAPAKIFLVQLSDVLWQETRSPPERMETARHSRVFPGGGVHSEKLVELVRALDEMGYRGDYSFEVFNDERARRSVKWITARVGRWSLPARQRA